MYSEILLENSSSFLPQKVIELYGCNCIKETWEYTTFITNLCNVLLLPSNVNFLQAEQHI